MSDAAPSTPTDTASSPAVPADAATTPSGGRDLGRLADLAPALAVGGVALRDMSPAARDETSAAVVQLLALLEPDTTRTTLLETPAAPVQLPTTGAAFRELMREPQRVFQTLSDDYGWRELDVRARNTVEALVVAARHVASLASGLRIAETEIRAHSESSSEAADVRVGELVMERDQLRVEIAALVEERDRLQADLADQCAKLKRTKAKVKRLVDERQRVFANRQTEETLRRASERRVTRLEHELAASQARLSEVQRASRASLGTADEVARFWSQTAGPTCNQEVLSFVLESCRRGLTQDWDQVMLAAIPIPGKAIPVLPDGSPAGSPSPPAPLSPQPRASIDIGDEPAGSSPKVPSTPSEVESASEDSGRSDSESPDDKFDLGGGSPRASTSDQEEARPVRDEARLELDEGVGSGGKRTAVHAGMTRSLRSSTLKRHRHPDSPDAGDEERRRTLIRAAFGDDELSEVSDQDSGDSADSAEEVLTTASTAGSVTSRAPVSLPAVANPAPAVTVPALGESQVSDVGSLVFDASWVLARRYAILRASPQYEAALPVASKRFSRPDSAYSLVPTDLRFAPGVIMGVSTTLPARRTEVYGWRVQRPRKEPNSHGYPDYIVLREKTSEYCASLSGKLPHYTALLESRPWDRMWLDRVRRLYLLDPTLLQSEEEAWLSAVCEFMFTHRQALWERNHWLALPHKESAYPWTPVLERRYKLAAYLDHAWKALTVTLRPRSWNRSFDPLLWQEPAFWNRADLHCTWVVDTNALPDNDMNALHKQLAVIDREEPIRVQFGGCTERFVEVLTIRNQRAFQLHHCVGASWAMPGPWGDAAYRTDQLAQRYTGTPGPDFYTSSFSPELLREFERRMKVVKDVGQLSNVPHSVRQATFSLDDFRTLLFAPLKKATEAAPMPSAA